MRELNGVGLSIEPLRKGGKGTEPVREDVVAPAIPEEVAVEPEVVKLDEGALGKENLTVVSPEQSESEEITDAADEKEKKDA